MLNQFAVEIPTLPVDQCHSHLIQSLKECQAVLLECWAAEKGCQAFGTHMVHRKTFSANSVSSCSAPYPLNIHHLKDYWGLHSYRSDTPMGRQIFGIHPVYKIHGVLLLKRTDRDDLIKAQIYLKPPIIIAMSCSWKASLQRFIQNWMTAVLGLLKSGKQTKTYDGSGLPDETSWRMVRKVRFGHEEILLDGTAQSAKNEETLRDRSGRPDNISFQEEFVIGNDVTELELSVESRSFVDRVNDQVRKRQKKFQCYRRWRRTYHDLENEQYSWEIISKTIRISMGILQISHSNKCSTNLRNWFPNKMRSQVWKRLDGGIIHGNICHLLVFKEWSIFNARRSTSFQILYCVLAKSNKILNLTKHGSKY